MRSLGTRLFDGRRSRPNSGSIRVATSPSRSASRICGRGRCASPLGDPIVALVSFAGTDEVVATYRSAGHRRPANGPRLLRSLSLRCEDPCETDLSSGINRQHVVCSGDFLHPPPFNVRSDEVVELKPIAPTLVDHVRRYRRGLCGSLPSGCATSLVCASNRSPIPKMVPAQPEPHRRVLVWSPA